MNEPKGKLNGQDLYLGDNGRCFCGSSRCAGQSSYYTGRDLSGQKVMRITYAMVKAEGMNPDKFKCEGCGKGLHAIELVASL
jgi:hypothetical protein